MAVHKKSHLNDVIEAAFFTNAKLTQVVYNFFDDLIHNSIIQLFAFKTPAKPF